MSLQPHPSHLPRPAVNQQPTTPTLMLQPATPDLGADIDPAEGWKSPSPLPRSFLPPEETEQSDAPVRKRPSLAGSLGRAPTLAELGSALRLQRPDKFDAPPSLGMRTTSAPTLATLSSLATRRASLSASAVAAAAASTPETSIEKPPLPRMPSLVGLSKRAEERRASVSGQAMNPQDQAEPLPSPASKSTPARVTVVTSDHMPLAVDTKEAADDTIARPASAPTDATAITGVNSHPLQHQWSFFFATLPLPPSFGLATLAEAGIASSLQEVGTVSDVEGFCRTLNWMKRPSQVRDGCGLHVFKDGIKPTWEDPMNVGGGRWTLTFLSADKDLLDRSWTWLIMALVGEELDEGDQIAGAVLAKRPPPRHSRIELWTKKQLPTPEATERLNSLGKRMVKILELGSEPGLTLEFTLHGEAVVPPELAGGKKTGVVGKEKKEVKKWVSMDTTSRAPLPASVAMGSTSTNSEKQGGQDDWRTRMLSLKAQSGVLERVLAGGGGGKMGGNKLRR